MLRRISPFKSMLLAWAVVAALAACQDPAEPAAATDAAASGDGAASSDAATLTDAAASGDTKADSGADAKADTVKAPCKPWEQPADWNCPPDTHCGYDDTDKIACVANGAHGAAEDCSDGKGCTIGMCVTAQNGSQACAPHCTTDGHCDSGSCNKIVGKTYSTCDVAKYTSCNPMASKCPANQGCYLLTGGFVCANAGTGVSGDKCTSSPDCSPGLTCAGMSAGGTGLCRKLCNVTPPTGCVDVTTPCSKLSATVGYCEEI